MPTGRRCIKASAHFSGVFYTFQTCPCSHTKFHSSCKKLLGKYERKCSCILCNRCYFCGPGSSVGIATELRAGRSGIESRWGRDFPPVQTGPGVHPASCKMGTGSFPGLKCGRGVLLTTHPLLVPRSRKSRAIPLPTFWAKPGL